MNDQELAEFLAAETGKLIANVAAEKFNDLTSRELGDAGDLAGHEFLMHQFAKYRPLDHVLSEEGEDNVGRLNADRVWIVDPLDGTSHYSKLESDYAVHIALWERSSNLPFEITASSVSVPAKDLVIGLNPKVNKSAQQLRAELVSKSQQPVRILVSATRPPAELDQICELLKEKFPERGEPKLIAMGSVGAKLAEIISGNADIYINTGGFYDWDIAAPAAIAVAHGLSACDITGAELKFNQADVFVPNAIIGHPEFVATITKSLA